MSSVGGMIAAALTPPRRPLTIFASRAKASAMPPSADLVITRHLRPAGRVVSGQHCGPGQPHATITAAINAAVAERGAVLALEGAIQPTPMYWIEIAIHPGSYSEPIATPIFCAIYSATGIPGDVQMTTPSASAASVIWSGPQQYYEGLTITNSEWGTGAWPKYPVHHSVLGTCTFVNCTFRALNQSSGYTQCIGADGGAGTVVIYGCTLISWPTNGAICDQVFGHGPGPNPDIPNRWILVNTALQPGGRVQATSSWSTTGAWMDWWLIDSTGTISLEGADTGMMSVHISGGSWVGAPGTGAIVDDRRDWPLPTDGLATADHDAYYGTPAT